MPSRDILSPFPAALLDMNGTLRHVGTRQYAGGLVQSEYVVAA